MKNQFTEKQISEINQIFRSNIISKSKTINSLAAELREKMDKDTLKVYFKKLSSQNFEKNIFEKVVLENIKTQSIVESANIFLKILGYFAMFLCAWFPSTAIHAAVFTVMSGLYNAQLIYQKYNQYKHQKTASKTSWPI